MTTVNLELRHATDPTTAKTYDTQTLRDNFHIPSLFIEGEINMVYSMYDRLIVGGALPAGGELVLDQVPETGTDTLLERREIGILNIGPAGTVSVAGESYTLDEGEFLYIGMGAGPITFAGAGKFYMCSAPAHRTCPTRHLKISDGKRVELGAKETANERVIIQFLVPDLVETCQLCMGYTQFMPGSVWNTMPCHTHNRRMEAYLYYGLQDDSKVFHFMGEPTETRHMVIGNEEAIISPPWSIHAGAGTGSYTFCWAMAGDNQTFTDMDQVPMGDLR